MFGLASGYYQNYLKPADVRILLVGLDGSGKTALLERLKVTDFKSVRQGNSGRRLMLTNNCMNQISAPQDDHNDDDNDDDDKTLSTKLSVDVSSRNEHPTTRMCPSPALLHKRQIQGDNDEEYVYDFSNSDGIRCRDKDIKTTGHKNGSYDKNSSSGTHSTAYDENRSSAPLLHTHQKKRSSDCGSQFEYVTKTESMESEMKQYDLKPNKNMFPMHLIKTTVGMNLGKLEGAGAKVQIMDLGGTVAMRPLWERYYSDIHGIAFVVDVSSTSPMSKIMESRAFYRCMRDDTSLVKVPILIFGNKVDDRSDYNLECGTMGNLDCNEGSSAVAEATKASAGSSEVSLLEIAELFLSAPRGSANSSGSEMEEEVAMYIGSAKTGNGVRTAFEWLINEAKVIEKERRLSV